MGRSFLRPISLSTPKLTSCLETIRFDVVYGRFEPPVRSDLTTEGRIGSLGIVSLPCLVNPSPVNGAPPHDELESQDRIGYRANRAVQNCGADAMLWSLPPMVSEATRGVDPCFR